MGEEPVGKIQLCIEGESWIAVAKPGGFYTFSNLPGGSFVLQLESQYYLSETRPLVLPLSDPVQAQLTIQLKPRWFYPFPGSSTVVMGRTVRADDRKTGIAGVKVQLQGRPLSTLTDRDGYFALYFRPLSDRDVVETTPAGQRLVKAADGSTVFKLVFTHEAFVDRTISMEGGIEAERVAYVKDPSEPTAAFGHITLQKS